MAIELFHVILLIEYCRHACRFDCINSRCRTVTGPRSQVEREIYNTLLSIQIFLLFEWSLTLIVHLETDKKYNLETQIAVDNIETKQQP